MVLRSKNLMRLSLSLIADSDITMIATSIIKRVAGGGIVENEEMSRDKFNALRSDIMF